MGALEGRVINDKNAILAPRNVTKRSGSLIGNPKEFFLDKFLAALDNAAKNVTKSKVQRLKILEEKND